MSTEFISPAETQSRLHQAGVKVSRSTIIRQCRERGLGIKVFGRWRITKDRIDDVIDSLREDGSAR